MHKKCNCPKNGLHFFFIYPLRFCSEMWPGHVSMRFSLKTTMYFKERRVSQLMCWCNRSLFRLREARSLPAGVCVCGDVKSPRVLFRQRRGWAAPHLSNHSVYSPYVSYSHWAAARYLHWIRVRSQLACCRLGGPQACAAIFGGGGCFLLLLFLISLTGMKEEYLLLILVVTSPVRTGCLICFRVVFDG